MTANGVHYSTQEGALRGLTGKHEFMLKGDLVLTIPNPHRGDIGSDLLAIVLRQARIARKQWERV